MRVDPDLINSAFRAVRFTGLGTVQHQADATCHHHLENLLDSLRLGKVALTPEVLDLLFEAIEHYQLISGDVADHGLGAGSGPSPLVNDL